MAKTWKTTVEQGPDGECFVTLPPEMMSELGWSDGDTLIWSILEDGSISVRKAAADEASVHPTVV